MTRLRAERRQNERRIRELEGQLADKSAAAARGGEPMPALPVQILTPEGGALPGEPALEGPEVAESVAAPDGPRATDPNERVVGVADDGSEIVYIDDAATGRVVSPSPEALAAMGRSARRSAPRPAPEGERLVDGEAHDRIEPLDEPAAEELAPPPLAKLGRRSARVRTQQRPPPAVASAAPSAPAAPTRSPGAQEHYRAAMALVRAASYADAITSLREFLQRHPRHDYADNAQYWLGEAYYAQRQYAQALAELRKVGELYPNGNKVPDALLKVGYCHLAMGDRETSAHVLRELVRLYPRSEPAMLAAKKLEEASL